MQQSMRALTPFVNAILVCRLSEPAVGIREKFRELITDITDVAEPLLWILFKTAPDDAPHTRIHIGWKQIQVCCAFDHRSKNFR
jgi:hypothetical protein